MRDGKTRSAQFHEGKLVEVTEETDTTEKNGTEVSFIPDSTIFLKKSRKEIDRLGSYTIETDGFFKGAIIVFPTSIHFGNYIYDFS